MVDERQYIQASTSYNTKRSLSSFAQHRPKTLQNATLTDLTKCLQSQSPTATFIQFSSLPAYPYTCSCSCKTTFRKINWSNGKPGSRSRAYADNSHVAQCHKEAVQRHKWHQST
ncbi:hypothetical protein T4B_6117 [Trichinella pseudospiralis]|uniref:Uncharacterized protein n=1 Tax=Trichinella pseudospiralis TaxID=6337 RepID=A0A0V1K7B4_TRIPS|nr:hypothetical protein T4A_654 [Trichinella pseudospiralis]KRZ27877.1 hypothetical protein T4B_6117 [Trichinella pseudospiralis]KRZ43097.1 hypothetical protein T4C_7118 [Trichinella pseudospiralis]